MISYLSYARNNNRAIRKTIELRFCRKRLDNPRDVNLGGGYFVKHPQCTIIYSDRKLKLELNLNEIYT